MTDSIDATDVPHPTTYVRPIDSPRALVEAVPHMLGFVPDASVVLSFMAERPDGAWRSFGSARVDLPEVDDVPGWIAGVLRPILDRVRPAALIVTYWLQGSGAAPRAAMLEHAALEQAMRRDIAQHGIRLLDAIAVVGERYTSLLCQDASCCGEWGEAWSSIDRSAVSAELVTAGLPMPAASRRDLEAELIPDADEARAFEQAREALMDDDGGDLVSIDVVRAVLSRWLDASDAATSVVISTDVPAIGLALLDGPARDECVGWLLDATADQLRAAQPWWALLVRTADLQVRVPAAAMAGLTSYLLGDGARANIAISCAVQAHTEWLNLCAGIAESGDAEAGGLVASHERMPPTLVRVFDSLFTAGYTPRQVRELLATAYRRATTNASAG